MLELVLIMLSDAPMRWSPAAVQTLGEHPAFVAAVRGDGAAVGHVSNASSGHESLVRWQDGQLVFEVTTYPHLSGGCFDDADHCFGKADVGNSVVVVRVDAGGAVTGSWPIGISPGLSGLVGAVGGEAIYRGVPQSGSSDWATWICRNDGSVDLIDHGGGPLCGTHVGRLSDGTQVLLGQYKDGIAWNVFLLLLDGTDTFTIVNDELDIPYGMVAPLGISESGEILLQRRDASYAWSPLIWNPDTGAASEGPTVTVGGYIDSGDADSGSVAATGTNEGQPAIWRWRPGGKAEVLTFNGAEILAVTDVNIAGDGTVVVDVLQFQPVYGRLVMVWPAGASIASTLRSRVVGSIAGGEGELELTAWHASGVGVVKTTSGLTHLRPLPPGDVDGDGLVDINDLLAVLDAWGPWDGPCGPDLDFTGEVDVNDVLLLLAGW